MKDTYGFLEQDWELMTKSFEKFPEIEEVILFGSRAMGNYKNGSDVDIAIAGLTVTHQTMLELNEWLNEIYPLPYMFDLQDVSAIRNQNLLVHIRTCGKRIYRKHV